MLDAAGTLSINRFTGNGVKTSWDINFAGGYMQRADVKAYMVDANDLLTILSFTWVSDNTISITPAVPNGNLLTIYRDTPKDAPVVDFTDGAIVNETNLDKLASQAVFTAAEMTDRFGVINARSNAAITIANDAKATSLLAIANASLIVGGDYTKFGRTDIAQSWTAVQTFTAGAIVPTRTAGDSTTNAASTAFVTQAIAPVITSVTTAVTTAATDATTKANAAQAAAIAAAATDATSKVAAATLAIDPDWLYTLASR